jgi:hypothetical protein
MALSQTDLDNLDQAIAASELEVEMDGRRVKYRSIAELLTARAHVAGVIAAAAVAPSGRRNTFSFRFTTSRGD